MKLPAALKQIREMRTLSAVQSSIRSTGSLVMEGKKISKSLDVHRASTGQIVRYNIRQLHQHGLGIAHLQGADKSQPLASSSLLTGSG